MAILGPKPWINPFGKMSFFSNFGTSCFYYLERRFFNLDYRKSHFTNLYCRKKNVTKMAIFGPKPWVNLFGKMSIFRLFEPQVFIAQKGVFSFYNIVKVIFQAYIQYKKVRKTASFGPKRWVNPFGKSSIFRHLVVLAFFIAQKGVSSFQNIVKVIFLTNIA